MSERVTAQSVASHRRFVLGMIINGLRAAFNASYDRDPQLASLKITQTYPLAAIDYPCIVVEYHNSLVARAGVGHYEYFTDVNNELHLWKHSRFEGEVTFEILGMTPLDRDLLADALTEIIQFGQLDTQLDQFYTTLYGDPNGPVLLWFNQIMFNSDEITSSGNTASLAPWSPEDLMVYQTSLSSEVHGGYYNVDPTDIPKYVTRVELSSYNPNDLPVVLDLTSDWNNPFSFYDDAAVVSKGNPTGTG